jgi:hypothetical protein
MPNFLIKLKNVVRRPQFGPANVNISSAAFDRSAARDPRILQASRKLIF